MAGLFGKPPAPPPPKPPAPMPDQNDPAVLAAERKRRQGMMNTGGRRSTLVGDAGGASISTEYSQDKIG